MSNISIKEKECQEEFEEDVLVRTAAKKFNNGILCKNQIRNYKISNY